MAPKETYISVEEVRAWGDEERMGDGLTGPFTVGSRVVTKGAAQRAAAVRNKGIHTSEPGRNRAWVEVTPPPRPPKVLGRVDIKVVVNLRSVV